MAKCAGDSQEAIAQATKAAMKATPEFYSHVGAEQREQAAMI
jgi:hypothetical protein